VFYVKYHYKTDVGIKNFTGAEAAKVAGENDNFATEELYNHLQSGKTATWTWHV
jgi:catalase